jgi:hypothetical protein
MSLKITKVASGVDTTQFRDLPIGELYDTTSCYGLCIKIGDRTAFSLSVGKEIQPAWHECYRVRAGLKYKRTG